MTAQPSSLASNQEWLETDGHGGFASGTVSGIRTRPYHALLLTAITPPTGRVLLVNGFDAWIETSRGRFALTSQRYAPDVIHPDGAQRIEKFSIEPWSTWQFKFEDGTEMVQEIFAVGGLPFPLLDGERAKMVVALIEETLLTPLGLRSLAPGEPDYEPHYEALRLDRVVLAAGQSKPPVKDKAAR